MSLTHLFVFIAAALALRLLPWSAARRWGLFAASALAIYWLQPLSPVRYLDYWFPTLTLALTALAWLLTTPAEARAWKTNWLSAAALAGIALLVALTRHLSLEGLITPGRPPATEQPLLALALVGLLGLGLARLRGISKGMLWAAIALLIALLVALKLPEVAAAISVGLRNLFEQSTARAAASDLRWLGFSYVAFRLIHTLRDRQSGRLPAVSLQEFVIYVIFFPSFTAGPIDRLDRFIKDLRKEQPLNAEQAAGAGQRLALGLLKKFVIADGLALVALNAQNAAQIVQPGFAWLLLYAYALQIYFDFSGYTDLAIGVGRILGINLPENFNNPYLRPNLTLFWNNWHMTLTNWFRAYFFNPVTRALRSGPRPLNPILGLFLTQLATFVLIGLWHGMTWNFVLWGAWHGVGLFLQNRWSEWMRPRYEALESRPRLHAGVTALTTLVTFHFVALGWVWFALPDVSLSLRVLGMLFGLTP